MIRPRFSGGMADIYPVASSGWRFSVGSRYFSKTNFWVAAEQATNGKLVDVRGPRGGRGLARGFSRFTPAATMGYDFELVAGLVAGIEGGALMGRAYAIPRPGSAYRAGEGGGTGMRGKLNPIANVALHYAF
ncbi:hypothetical protein [uncultured Sphingomonas sp.]|uniref:hypothetical protein n=1 Tax=uncultured Sphingomonas sp. TaxID=158754 RepID=UPI0035CB580C